MIITTQNGFNPFLNVFEVIINNTEVYNSTYELGTGFFKIVSQKS